MLTRRFFKRPPFQGSPEHPLLNRNFVLLWQGQVVSQIGSQAFAVATMFWVMEATQSAGAMGVIMMLSTLPMVLLSPIGGTIADWYPRRSVIITCDLISGVTVLMLAGAMFWWPDDPAIILAWLGITTVVVGAVRAFFQPAVSAATPDLVAEEHVAAANSMMQFAGQASTIVGQALGGILYRILGAPLLILVDGLSYLFSAFSEAFITIPSAVPARPSKPGEAFAAFLADTRAGFDYVWSNRGMRTLLLASAAVNFFVMPILVLLPFYVDIQLGSGAAWYGFLLAAVSAGSILGYVLAGIITTKGTQRARLVIASFFTAALTIGLLGATTSRSVALALMLGVGISSGFINVHVITLFQTQSRPELRGRALSLLITLSSAVVPLGMLMGGILGDVTGKNLPAIFLGSGGCAALVVLMSASSADLRAFLAADAVVLEEPPVSA